MAPIIPVLVGITLSATAPGANQNGQTYYWCKEGDLYSGGAPEAGIETFSGLFKCNGVPAIVIVNSFLSQKLYLDRY